MKNILLTFLFLFTICNLNAAETLRFYLDKALENNLELNAERKNLESAKQSKNISRSEFLPSIAISGDQTSTTSSNRTDQTGSSLIDTNLD